MIPPGWVFIKFCWIWKAGRRAVNSSRHRSTLCFKRGYFLTLTGFSKYISRKSDWGISGPWLAPIECSLNPSLWGKSWELCALLTRFTSFYTDNTPSAPFVHRQRSRQRSPACSIRHRWKVTTQIQTLDCVSSPCLGAWVYTPSLF